MEERRKFIRVKGPAQAEYKVKGRLNVRKVPVKDVSVIGINLFVEEPLSKGAELELMFEIPNTREQIIAQGRVLWQHAAADGAQQTTGIRFTSMSEAARKLLADFIAESGGRSEEKREFVRCALNADVTYYFASDPEKKGKGKCLDISRGGIKLAAPEKIDTGTVLNVVLNLPEERRPVTFDGRIVWARPGKETGYEIGMRFGPLSPEVKDRIWKFIDAQRA